MSKIAGLQGTCDVWTNQGSCHVHVNSCCITSSVITGALFDRRDQVDCGGRGQGDADGGRGRGRGVPGEYSAEGQVSGAGRQRRAGGGEEARAAQKRGGEEAR